MPEEAPQPAAPDLSPEEFFSTVGASRRPVPGTTARPVSADLMANPPLPATQEALADAQRMAQRPVGPLETGVLDPEAARLGKQLGVPLESGVDTWTYLQYKWRQNAEDQIRFLAKKFGPENVRLNDLGKPVVSITDEKGNRVDHTVDPFDINSQSVLGFLMNNAASIGASAFSVSGSRPKAVAGALSKIPGLGRLAGKEDTFLFRSVLGATAAETANALKDVGTQAYDRPTVDLTGILGEHIAQLPVDVALDYGMVKGAGGIKWAYDLLSGRPVPNPAESSKRLLQAMTQKLGGETEQSKVGKGAAAYFASKGVPYKATIGETTDIPLVAMGEAYLGREAAGAGPIKARVAESEQSNRAIQRYILGSGTLPLDEEIGNRGIAALRQSYDQADAILTTLEGNETRAIQQSAQKRLLDSFGLSNLPERGYPWVETGDYLRGMGTKSRDAFWDDVGAKYDALYSHPAAAERTAPTGSLVERVKQLLKEQPSVEEKVSSNILDQFGNPFEESRTVPLKEFIPDGVLARLNDLLKLEGQKTSVLDLKAARTEVNNAIKRSQALTNTKDHYLTEIAKALDGSLQEAIDSSTAPELRQLFDSATQTYKAGVGKFKDKLLTPIWAHPEEMAVDNGRLVTLLENSPGRYKALKAFFGDGSEALNGFQDTVKKKLFSDSLAASGTTVDPDALVKSIIGMAKSNPELYKDVVGNQFDDLLRASASYGAVNGKVDLQELSTLAASGAPVTRDQVERLAKIEEARAKLYNNSVVKKFLKGGDGAPPIDPENFVRYLTETNKKDAEQVMAALNPTDADAVRRKVLQDIFRKASRNPGSEDIVAQLKGDPTYLVSLKGLQDVLATDEQKAVYRAILGPDKYNDLQQYVALQMLPAQKAERARQVGMLVGGESTGQAIKGLLSPASPKTAATLSQWAKIKLLSVFLSHDWGVDALNSLQSKVPPPIIGRKLGNAATSAIIASEPFVKALGEEFKDPLVRFQVASYLKRISGMSTDSEMENPTPQDFEKSLQPPPKP